VRRCLSIKGAEDLLNKPHAFEISTTDDSMFFIADTDKARALPRIRHSWIALRPCVAMVSKTGIAAHSLRLGGRLDHSRSRCPRRLPARPIRGCGAPRQRSVRPEHGVIPAVLCGLFASSGFVLRGMGRVAHARVPQEKEDWINAVGRAIVRHSKRRAPRHRAGAGSMSECSYMPGAGRAGGWSPRGAARPVSHLLINCCA